MKKSYKIIFLGNTSVGKTMLIYRYISDGVTFSEPTIGIDFFSSTLEVECTEKVANNEEQNYKFKKAVRLQLWDTAGQERYKSIITPYIRDSFLAVIVYACNDRNSFNQLKYWIDMYTNKNNYKNFKILIVCNKWDLHEEEAKRKDKNNTNNFVSLEEGEEFAAKNNCAFCTASALDKHDIQNMINQMKIAIADDLVNNPDQEEREGVNMLKTKNRGFCC